MIDSYKYCQLFQQFL